MDQELRFKKSSFSENNGACVEVAKPGPGSAVRDSKNITGPTLKFGGAALSSFIGKIKAGSMDLPS